MVYISWEFYGFVIVLLIFYYLMPIKYRWTSLLAGSLFFFYWIDKSGFIFFLVTVLLSYLMGLFLYRICNPIVSQTAIANQLNITQKNDCIRTSSLCKTRKAYFFVCIVLIAAPLVVTKHAGFVLYKCFHISANITWIVPLGIAFYTMQIISYLADIYKGKIMPERNIFRYTLFVSFFPQIVQGPIPRYAQLNEQLYLGHKFNERLFSKGAQLIVYGFFLKLMIADRAAIIVNTVFDQFPIYQGGYILVAGILYSIQLYTDFMSCVAISQGCASLFGIELTDNFRHPYFSCSVKEFWRRWHISLSSWLRDYIYIPLGGSRNGLLHKYINVMITFAVSGLWHGTGYKYVFWGLLHANYQIAGEILAPFKTRIYTFVKISEDSFLKKFLQLMGTFLYVMLAWIIFRARSLKIGILMIVSMFTVYNPWIFFNDSMFCLGIEWKECILLIGSILLLFLLEWRQEHICIRDWILKQHLIVRWGIYCGAICGICIFGVYGFGFNAQEFIYGGF